MEKLTNETKYNDHAAEADYDDHTLQTLAYADRKVKSTKETALAGAAFIALTAVATFGIKACNAVESSLDGSYSPHASQIYPSAADASIDYDNGIAYL